MFWQLFSALMIITAFGVVTWFSAHARKETIYRHLSILIFLMSIPVTVAAFIVTLGTALPVVQPFVELPKGEVRILGHRSVPKVGIYILIDRGERQPPDFYWLPWDKKTSEKLEMLQYDEYGSATLEFEVKEKAKWYDPAWIPPDDLKTKWAPEAQERVLPDKIPQEGAGVNLQGQ